MAQRGIRKFDAKRIPAERLPDYIDDFDYDGKIGLITPETDQEAVEVDSSWVKKKRVVVKPDQLFGKRGACGLVLLDATWAQAKKYIQKNMGREVLVGTVIGIIVHILDQKRLDSRLYSHPQDDITFMLPEFSSEPT